MDDDLVGQLHALRTGRLIGRSSWRYACPDDSDRDFVGHEHGDQGFQRPSR